MPIRTRFWAELRWPEFRDLPENTVAVLPIAATEQHGPHLPLATDCVIAEGYLARLRALGLETLRQLDQRASPALRGELTARVFALDGVLLGSGDAAYLRTATLVAALVGFLPLIWLSLAFDWGLAGIWTGLVVFMVIRMLTVVWRIRSGRWQRVGRESR